MWRTATLVANLPTTGSSVKRQCWENPKSVPFATDSSLSTNKQNHCTSPSILETQGVNALRAPENCSPKKVSPKPLGSLRWASYKVLPGLSHARYCFSCGEAGNVRQPTLKGKTMASVCALANRSIFSSKPLPSFHLTEK